MGVPNSPSVRLSVSGVCFLLTIINLVLAFQALDYSPDVCTTLSISTPNAWCPSVPMADYATTMVVITCLIAVLECLVMGCQVAMFKYTSRNLLLAVCCCVSDWIGLDWIGLDWIGLDWIDNWPMRRRLY